MFPLWWNRKFHTVPVSNARELNCHNNDILLIDNHRALNIFSFGHLSGLVSKVMNNSQVDSGLRIVVMEQGVPKLLNTGYMNIMLHHRIPSKEVRLISI